MRTKILISALFVLLFVSCSGIKVTKEIVDSNTSDWITHWGKPKDIAYGNDITVMLTNVLFNYKMNNETKSKLNQILKMVNQNSFLWTYQLDYKTYSIFYPNLRNYSILKKVKDKNSLTVIIKPDLTYYELWDNHHTNLVSIVQRKGRALGYEGEAAIYGYLKYKLNPEGDTVLDTVKWLDK